MKRIIALLMLSIFLFAGCSKDIKEEAIETGDITISNEKIIKEFTGTLNIFNRYGDIVMLSTDTEDVFKNYDVDMNSGQVNESQLNDMMDQYVYYEPVGTKGYLVVEGEEYRNILKFKGKDGAINTIANDIGLSDAINISVSPKGNKVAYTALQEGSENLGLYIYDIASSSNHKLMDIKSDGFIEDFNYLVSWSPDEKHVIIQDKYIYDTENGSNKGELKSVYSQWSPSGFKIAFILDDGSGQKFQTADYSTYPGKTVCIYDISKGSYEEIFALTNDEHIFGGMAWSGNENKIAFTGVKIEDENSPDWYMKLNYSSVYIVEVKDKKAKRVETNVDASDGAMIELGNLKFTKEGGLLCYTVGNYEKSKLYVLNTGSLKTKAFENAEYLHWIDNENYGITAGKNSIYFSVNNSILRIDEKLEESVKYTSKTRLDDFFLSRDGNGMLLFEEQGDGYVARYIGK